MMRSSRMVTLFVLGALVWFAALPQEAQARWRCWGGYGPWGCGWYGYGCGLGYAYGPGYYWPSYYWAGYYGPGSPATPGYYAPPAPGAYYNPPPAGSYAANDGSGAPANQAPSGQRRMSYRPPGEPAADNRRASNVVDVKLHDDQVLPPTLTVAKGTTVRWVNYGKHAHTVTSAKGKWDSGDLRFGESFSAKFLGPGTYEYYCRHHETMHGTIVVK